MKTLAETTKKDYRIFGMVLGTLFMFIWVVRVWIRGEVIADSFTVHPVVSTLGCLGLTLFVLGLLIPAALKYPYIPFFYLGRTVAWLNTVLLLFLSYVLVIVPTGLFLKVFKKDPMNRKLDPDAASYWSPREDRKKKSIISERQF